MTYKHKEVQHLSETSSEAIECLVGHMGALQEKLLEISGHVGYLVSISNTHNGLLNTHNSILSAILEEQAKRAINE